MTGRRRRAFTLVEIVVTVVVASIIAGIVAASALTATGRAEDELTQGALRRFVVLEQQVASTWGSYTPLPADLSVPRDELQPVAGVAGAGQVSIAVGDDGTLGLATLNGNGDCHGLRVSSVETGGEQTEVLVDDEPCDAVAVLPAGEAPVEPVTVKF